MKICSRFLLSLLVFFMLSSMVDASSWTKYPDNPIFSGLGLPGIWDSVHVANPFVTYGNGTYRMWYQGTNSKWQIGYTTSLNGISGWDRLPYSIIYPDSTNIWENEDEDPTIVYALGKYRMWYSAVKATWAQGGIDRMELRYAESDLGTNWVKLNCVMKGTLGTWDAGGINRGKSILYKDGVFHMWYTGTNENPVETNPYWRIGYATSNDGCTWIKQNNSAPVIEPTETWELNNVSFPNVIFENGIYHMWYAAGTGNAPTRFVYAYSTDGIGWIKPKDQNPVLDKGESSSFDSDYVTQPFVLHDDGEYKMWYSGMGSGKWSIGYATNPTIPIPLFIPTPRPTATPIPTPTNTPIPTPTNTPTPNPTPTPSPSKKVIVIPGIGGSWNRDALLNCKSSGYSGNWSNWTVANADIYQPLLTGLTSAGYQPIPFWYDWRKRVTDSAIILNSFINQNRESDEVVDVVGHSMGGFVGRAYLESTKESSHTDAFLTVGTPHEGVALAYPAWSGGEIWIDDVNMRLAFTMLQIGCSIRHGWSGRETVANLLPSIRNILPTFPYLKDKLTGSLKPASSMSAKNNWLPTAFNFPFFGVRMGTLTGTGRDTLKQIEVTSPSRLDQRLGNWLDGKPTGNKYYADGDGTVLTTSGQLPDVENHTLPLSHSGLVTNQLGIQAIIDFLNDTTEQQPLLRQMQQNQQLIKPTRRTTALLIVVDGAHASLTDKNGKTYQDADGQITILEPSEDSYTLRVTPDNPRWWPWWRKHENKVLVIQLFEDGTSKWKAYSQTGFSARHWKLRFDRLHKTEDILHEN